VHDVRAPTRNIEHGNVIVTAKLNYLRGLVGKVQVVIQPKICNLRIFVRSDEISIVLKVRQDVLLMGHCVCHNTTRRHTLLGMACFRLALVNDLVRLNIAGSSYC
jgi:hypothetical protein